MKLLEATQLRDHRWAVRPIGRLGTCGWDEGVAWTVFYVKAHSGEEAIRKARGKVNAPPRN